MRYTVYLSGEIHSDWRDQIKRAINQNGLPIDVLTPNTNHESSDGCATEILGPETSDFWTDHKSAKNEYHAPYDRHQTCGYSDRAFW